MHTANKLYLSEFARIYPEYCSENTSVIEFGSYNVNGSAREYITPVKEWVGVDWRPGPEVDVVSLAHEVDLNRQFDVVISASLLEHDPYWERTLETMVRHLKDSGVLLLSWCAGYSIPHHIETAPDGQYHVLRAGLVLDKLERLGIYIHRFNYECSLYPKKLCRYSDGRGEVELTGFIDPKYAKGTRNVDILLEKDESI